MSSSLNEHGTRSLAAWNAFVAQMNRQDEQARVQDLIKPTASLVAAISHFAANQAAIATNVLERLKQLESTGDWPLGLWRTEKAAANDTKPPMDKALKCWRLSILLAVAMNTDAMAKSPGNLDWTRVVESLNSHPKLNTARQASGSTGNKAIRIIPDVTETMLADWCHGLWNVFDDDSDGQTIESQFPIVAKVEKGNLRDELVRFKVRPARGHLPGRGIVFPEIGMIYASFGPDFLESIQFAADAARVGRQNLPDLAWSLHVPKLEPADWPVIHGPSGGAAMAMAMRRAWARKLPA